MTARDMEATGRTLLAYLTEVRLARARELLNASDEAVSQVAHRVGYEDAATFTALFRRHHEQTPAAYRESSRGSAG
ncbi:MULTISPECIES: helix-turn-helix domain-containing protein [Corallococcus]|uniref:helix-turn-helix domain-containing protein n=1 Tax=Corallococcus TaxID=83461 RepID=UPI001F199EE0|nr:MULTISPECIES: helix-turn-helix transcriptional regulator [unclassified Corallococcus]